MNTTQPPFVAKTIPNPKEETPAEKQARLKSSRNWSIFWIVALSAFLVFVAVPSVKNILIPPILKNQKGVQLIDSSTGKPMTAKQSKFWNIVKILFYLVIFSNLISAIRNVIATTKELSKL
jgi:uncharacterized membrane protein YhaH (DUF805 family)